MYKFTYKHLQYDTSMFNKKNNCKYIVGSPFSLRFDNVQVGSHLQTSASVPYLDTV